ncbi:hypothetical protein D3C87_2153960 [compost metagenome]
MCIEGVRQLAAGKQQIFLLLPTASRSQVPIDVDVRFGFDILEELIIIQVFA